MDSETSVEGLEADETVGAVTRAFFAICLVLVLGFGLWITFGELDIVSVATYAPFHAEITVRKRF